MTLSKRGDYVMRSAITLARAYDSGAPRKIREVVLDTEMPRTFASQILADLVRAGVAVSKAGREGGYWLARPPGQISVLEVIEAAEGPLRAERCALGNGPCRWDDVCPLHATWSAATAELRSLLAATTLDEVAARDAAIEAGTYDIPVDSHRTHALSVDVADMVHVELPEEAVRGAISKHGIELGSLVDQAVADAEGLAAGQPGARARCSLGPLRRRRGVEQPARSSLAWQIPGSDASHFDGELSVTVVDAERSQLHVEGAWHQDLSGIGPLTTAELDQQARRVLRGFLRRLAHLLENPVAVPEDATGQPPAHGRARQHTVAVPEDATGQPPARGRARQRTA